ncbi:hypothetical protein ADN00_14075 [Ornatilinea apprima]|uniref:Glycosyltransferase RgtA/B/C/D-like domain-containing protein n=1 Tax=Ornatilinea apprima TaxID=1134406 RepID=A0A0P6X313_9CHLR|nr:hypothetical protein [Ornatilinea apprima]KPL74125.1 hypothetical protein ADN00_14075 [Ornatilinea apprima]
MKQLLNRWRFPHWSVPIALLALCLLSFGLLLPQMGFYWDDWAKMLVNRIFGPQGYWAYYAEDRPISGWTHIFLTPLLGEAPLGWQIFVLLMRWLTAVGLWWSFSLVWPGARRAVSMAALLFVVSPIFTMQPIAVTFHQQWLQFALFAFSLAFMVLAWRKPRLRLPLTLLAVFFTLAQLTVTEYFIGLELLRPAVLLVLSLEEKQPWGRRLLRVLAHWAPYLLVLVAYVVWRLFFIQLTGEDPYQAETLFGFFSDPRGTLGWLWQTVAFDSLFMLVTAWQPVLSLGYYNLPTEAIKSLWGLGLLAGGLCAVYLLGLRDDSPAGEPAAPETEKKTWLLQALFIGLVIMLVGSIPAWSTGRQVVTDIHSNRYALPGMFGPSLLLVALLEWAVQKPVRRALAFSALIGAAVIFHYTEQVKYRDTWQQEMSFFWQLSWRAPYLEPNTAVITENPIFTDQGGFSIAAALNLLYPQEKNPPTLAYWYYALKPRFTLSTVDPLGIPLRTQFRTLVFEGQTPQSLLVMADPAVSECIWVLDANDAADPDLSELARHMLPMSSPERIQFESPDDSYPPRHLFNQEPDHGWCYIYQKTELALQMQDNQRAAELADQARAIFADAPYTSRYDQPHEWLPMVEAYARTARWEDAASAALTAAGFNPNRYGPWMCAEWQRIADREADSPEKSAATRQLKQELNCQP